MSRSMTAIRLIIAGAFLLTSLCGCGKSTMRIYPAGGKVVFPNGTPLKGGWVWTRPVQAKDIPGARGEIQPDGTFHLGTYRLGDGAVEGEHLVLIAPLMPRGDRTEMLKLPALIDPRFEQFTTSGLKISVASDASKNQFVLPVERPNE
jgi:hypothetical protein